MEDSIPEVSLALTEGQEGELVSTMPPCSGSSISGQVSPCNTKAHLEVPKPNITVHEQKREKSHSLPLQYKCLPHCNTSGTNRKGSASLQLHTNSKQVWAKVSHLLKVFSGTFTRATNMQPASALKPRFPHKAF